MEGRDEALLAEAIEAARSAEVDAEDLGKAEAKLAELRSMSEEERAAKDLNELVQAQKKEAFLMVKRDDPAGLKELLEGVDATVRWQDWKDYMGRSLLRFSQELFQPIIFDKSVQQVFDAGFAISSFRTD